MATFVVRRAIRATLLAITVSAAVGGTVSAGSPVGDLDALQPPPPPGAVCMAVGSGTVRCDTFKDFPLDHEAVLDLPCGPVYETSTDHRDGIRWYRGGVLVKRHVDEDASGFWSTSPTADDGPVHLFAGWASTSTWLVPGDDSTVQERVQGVELRISGPDGRPIVNIAGQDALDGSHYGIADGLTDDFTPEAYGRLTAALCG